MCTTVGRVVVALVVARALLLSPALILPLLGKVVVELLRPLIVHLLLLLDPPKGLAQDRVGKRRRRRRWLLVLIARLEIGRAHV